MSGLWRAIATSTGSHVVIGGDEPDPDEAAMRRLDDALVASGMDALASWVPVTDAIVRISDEHVVEHLDRSQLGRCGVPQIISAAAWNRFRAGNWGDPGVLPATVVASHAGRVGVLDDGALGPT